MSYPEAFFPRLSFPINSSENDMSFTISPRQLNRVEIFAARQEYADIPPAIKQPMINIAAFILSMRSRDPAMFFAIAEKIAEKIDSLGLENVHPVAGIGQILNAYEDVRKDVLMEEGLTRRQKETRLKDFLRVALAMDISHAIIDLLQEQFEERGLVLHESIIEAALQLCRRAVTDLTLPKRSIEVRNKIGRTLKRLYRNNPSLVEAVRESNRRRVITDTMRINIGEGVKRAYNRDPNLRLKISKAAESRMVSEEYRKSRSEAMKRTMERDPRILETLHRYRLKEHTPEARAKISKARQEYLRRRNEARNRTPEV